MKTFFSKQQIDFGKCYNLAFYPYLKNVNRQSILENILVHFW